MYRWRWPQITVSTPFSSAMFRRIFADNGRMAAEDFTRALAQSSFREGGNHRSMRSKSGPSVSVQQSEPCIGLGECMSVREKDFTITYRDENLLGAYDRNTRQVGILQKEVPVARQQTDFGGSKCIESLRGTVLPGPYTSSQRDHPGCRFHLHRQRPLRARR